MQAIVSGSRDAARKLAEFHAVPEVVAYDGYDALLVSDRIDAVYIALPNSMHADYTHPCLAGRKARDGRETSGNDACRKRGDDRGGTGKRCLPDDRVSPA